MPRCNNCGVAAKFAGSKCLQRVLLLSYAQNVLTLQILRKCGENYSREMHAYELPPLFSSQTRV